MGNFLASIGSTYYLRKIEQSTTVLHYRRSPTWRSLVIFVVLFAILVYIASKSPYPSVRVFCYIVGAYFCYLTTEKYEEVRFDKSKGTVELMNSRFLEKHLIGYRRKVVTELESIVSVSMESQQVWPGVGYTVVLLLFSGMTLALTAQCTFGSKKEHESIAKEIRKFLGSSDKSEETNYSRTKKED